jgi:hypothetical protein
VKARRLGLALLATLLLGALVWLAGRALTPAPAHQGVLLGAAMATGWQLLVLGVVGAALPGSPLLAHGVGMLARLALLVAAMLVLVPLLRLPPAPTLLTMVTVLFATTLIEPVAFAAGARNDKGR